MYSLILLAVSSFGLSFLLTPVIRNLFLRLGLVDRPDQIRKLHISPVPRVGGISIAAAYVGAFALLFATPFQGRLLLGSGLDIIERLLPAAGVIFLTGLMDDLFTLKPWQKLVGQIAGACWAYAAGVRVLAGGQTGGSWWSLGLTLLWLLMCTNAFNLIDGMDGLAAGLGLMATLTTFVAALLEGNLGLALATAPLAGALLGFLRYNFNPASVFLGDCGSLPIGFLLGCYAVLWSQKSATLLGMTAPVMALALPLADTALSVLRRFLRGRPIFGADRGHIHHRLLERGLTVRGVTLILYGIGGTAASFSLLESVFRNQFAGIVLILFCAAAWAGFQNLGYPEFSTARRLLTGSFFRHALNAQLELRTLDEALRNAQTFDQCWSAVLAGAQKFGFRRIRMRIGGRTSEEPSNSVPPARFWTVRLAITKGNYLNLTRDMDEPSVSMALASFLDVVASGLHAFCIRTPPENLTTGDEAVAAKQTAQLARLVSAVDNPHEMSPEPAGRQYVPELLAGFPQ